MLDSATATNHSPTQSSLADFAALDASAATFSAVSTHSTAKKSPPVPLRDLPAGQLATITSLHGNAHEVARLAEMGLRTGTDVVVIRNGITCIVQLDGCRLCIRLSADLQILVSVQESGWIPK